MTDEPFLSVEVVRSGGFAGLRRSWQISIDAGGTEGLGSQGPASSPGTEPVPEPSLAEPAAHWCALVEACPWDASPATTGADRFVYEVRATGVVGHRQARLGEQQLQGPWAALVEAVQQADRPTRGD